MCGEEITLKIHIFPVYLIFMCFNLIYCLVELSAAKDNHIIVSDRVIGLTFNKLFSMIKLKKVHPKSRLQEYSTLHKNLVFLPLQDHMNINEIVKIVKAREDDKNIRDLRAVIDELLEEESHHIQNKMDRKENADIKMYIDRFLNNLQQLNEEYRVSKAYAGINKEVLNVLKSLSTTLINDSVEQKNESNKSDDDILDDNEFWEPSGRRIFKGERSKIKHFPFMATIQIFNNFHCAGSIIKSDLIITASSCLQLAWNNRFFRENPAFLTARVGSSFYNSGGEVIPILEIYFHPLYDPKTLRNNICVLRLTRQLKFRRKSKKVKKIDIDRSEAALALNTHGITVVGWGAREHSPIVGNPWKYIISYAVLDVYPLWDCQDVYSKEFVTKKNFCAGFLSRGGGACNKDVGGPGIIDGKLMGVISFGSPVCGTPDAPTVFTKIGYYADWIEQIMEQNVPVSKTKTTLRPYIDPFRPLQTTRPPKPTTFKIAPITDETMTPIPISQIDNQLRIIDEKLFKDFLATMFNSKEIEEYKDIIKENDKKPESMDSKDKFEVRENVEFVTKFEEAPESYTKIKDFSSEGKLYHKTSYTVMEDNYLTTDTFDGEIAKIIKEINLEKIVEEEIGRPKSKGNSETKSNNESVLTLLYISDNENGNSKLTSKKYTKESNSDEGMSIPIDNFNDLTRTKDLTSVLPERELYELLSEVVGEEVRNIDIKHLSYFYFIIYLGKA